jgi:CRISPR-associated endonuclease/helicase Cas3
MSITTRDREWINAPSGFAAHLDGADGRPHDLVEHLQEVARLAGDFAETACPGLGRLADVAGWLHDLGKFRGAFQEYLHGRWNGPEKEKRHAVYGAAAAIGAKLPSVAFAVLGHHAGLHDLGGIDGLQSSLKDPDLEPLKAAPDLVSKLESLIAGAMPALRDCPRDALMSGRDSRGNFCATLDVELRVRILFSCLVDADYLDTERYFTGKARGAIALDAALLATLLERLSAHICRLADSAEDNPVNQARRCVYEACRRASSLPPGMFSLTAPTGSGKTLAAMTFALEHARHHSLRRVIVVLPFLAIIEQNARVYREALNVPGQHDVVLEHHSAVARDGHADLGEDNSEAGLRAKQATENWDAPVIVTTAVQFLESLFSRRPGRCRKLHNIGRSVVIFDEVQTLPFPLLDPILSVLRDLAKDFGVSALLCSATRPTFASSADLPSGFLAGECRELIDDRHQTFSTLRRARIEIAGTLSWQGLADRLEYEPMALVIVNLRRHAQELYDVLKIRGRANLFHLSSTMCPAHRERALGRKETPAVGTIYRALDDGNCLLVSTQVVEAGVDIDFPVVYRGISPLDSIIQAAGRCDREGEMTKRAGSPAGRMIVFTPEGEDVGPPGYYQRATGDAVCILEAHAGDPSRILDDPSVYEAYHALLVAKREGHDSAQLVQQERRALNFKTVDSLFKVIDDAGQGVVVPFAEGAELAAQMRRKGHATLDDHRKLQRFTVGLMPNWVKKFLGQGLIEPLIKGEPDGLLWYVGGNYDECVGLRLGELPPEAFCVG